jgi:hypothetical protein
VNPKPNIDLTRKFVDNSSVPGDYGVNDLPRHICSKTSFLHYLDPTPTDRAVIDMVAQFGLCRSDQILRVHFKNHNYGRNRLTQLTKAHLLERYRLLGINRVPPYVYVLGREAHRVIPLEKTKGRSRVNRKLQYLTTQLMHHLDCVETYVQLVLAMRKLGAELSWQTEREASRVNSLELRPDGIADIAAPNWQRRLYIEVDRSTEARRVLDKKIDRYVSQRLRYEDQSFVLFVTETERRARSISELFGRHPLLRGGVAQLTSEINEPWALAWRTSAERGPVDLTELLGIPAFSASRINPPPKHEIT